MNITHYLKNRKDPQSRQILFEGEPLTMEAVWRLCDKYFPPRAGAPLLSSPRKGPQGGEGRSARRLRWSRRRQNRRSSGVLFLGPLTSHRRFCSAGQVRLRR